jgi:hypothetical protein
MNKHLPFDRTMLSFYEAAAALSGHNYGSDHDFGDDGVDLSGRKIEAFFHIDTTFTTGADVIEVRVCSGAAASPTTIVRTIYSGAASGFVAGLEKSVFMENELNRYARIDVFTAAVHAAGKLTAGFRAVI